MKYTSSSMFLTIFDDLDSKSNYWTSSYEAVFLMYHIRDIEDFSSC